MTFEGTIDIVKQHKVLFGVIAGAILLYFLWPSSNSGSGSSSITAQEETAIATASQANAAITQAQIQSQTTLGVASDQLQAYGIGAATAQSINATNNAAKTQQTQIAADVQDAQTAAALQALQTTDSTNISLAKLTNDSQNSAQAFISDLEHAGLNTPDYKTTGGTFGATDTQTVWANRDTQSQLINAQQQVDNASISSNERLAANAQGIELALGTQSIAAQEQLGTIALTGYGNPIQGSVGNPYVVTSTGDYPSGSVPAGSNILGFISTGDPFGQNH